MSGRRPTGHDVRGADWYGEDLSGQEHTRVVFSGVDLSESTDDGAVFTGCSFFQAEFLDCTFTGSAFDRCTFDPRSVQLSGAQIDLAQAVALVTALGLDVRPDAPE